jgi:adenylate cyclase
LNDASLDPSEVIEHLERVLLHPEFAASPRLTAFLRFVVNETLEGRASRVKAYTIATTVFGRSESFDPQTNPVVRVEAMRLRQALTHYYATEGANDALEIRIGRGSYVPEFLRREREGAPNDSGGGQSTTPKAVPRRSAGLWAPAAALAAVCVIGAATYALSRRPASQRPPAPAEAERVVSILPTINVNVKADASEPRLGAFADRLTTQLETALSRFEYPIVQQKPQTAPMYRLDASVRTKGGDRTLVDVKIIHGASGTILWAGEFDGGPVEALASPENSLAGQIAAAISQTYGLIFVDLRKRVAAYGDGARGFACLVVASAALAQGADRPRQEAQTCLENTISGEPGFAAAQSALTFIGLARYLDGFDESGERAVDSALSHAGRAVALTPNKSRAHAAQFWARFMAGRYDDAFESAATAMELNPDASDTVSRIGAAYMLRGEYDKGVALMRKASNRRRWSPGWQEFFFFLDAHLRGDEDRAARHAMRVNALTSPLGHIARIIAVSKTGDAARIEIARKDFQSQFPRFAADVAAGLDRYRMKPELRDRLLHDLSPAAAPATPEIR